MRVVFSVIVVAITCLTANVKADVKLVYDGHGVDFRWSNDTNIAAPTRISGPSNDMPGTGSHSTVQDLAQDGAHVEGSLITSTSMIGQSLRLEQNVSELLTSSTLTSANKQFEIAQYTYSGFTVTETNIYRLDFVAAGDFLQMDYPHFPSSYNYAGTDSVFNVYDFTTGTEVPVTKFSLSDGATGANTNYVFKAQFTTDSTERTMTQFILLEAGKLYRADTYSYTYIGGDGSFTGRANASNSLTISAVPEPTSLILLGSSLSLAGVRALRKRRQSTKLEAI